MSRADRVAGRLEDVDALLVTEPANLRYVTGFTGSNGFALVGRDVRRFVTDFRYVEQAKVGGRRLRPRAGAAGALRGAEGLLRAARVRRRAPVGEGAPAARRAARGRRAGGRGGRRRGRAGGQGARRDPAHRRRRGARRRDLRVAAGAPLVGRTERSVAIALEHEMRLRGASGPSFPSIVASAEHGALPHAQPRDVAIVPDTLVTIDIGAVLDGYCSDCTRTWATGDLPDELAEAYALVAARAGRRAGRGAAGPARARDRRGGARAHRRRRARRALRPRARPRRRPRHPRGAAARPHRRERAGGRATS